MHKLSLKWLISTTKKIPGMYASVYQYFRQIFFVPSLGNFHNLDEYLNASTKIFAHITETFSLWTAIVLAFLRFRNIFSLNIFILPYYGQMTLKNIINLKNLNNLSLPGLSNYFLFHMFIPECHEMYETYSVIIVRHSQSINLNNINLYKNENSIFVVIYFHNEGGSKYIQVSIYLPIWIALQ